MVNAGGSRVPGPVAGPKPPGLPDGPPGVPAGEIELLCVPGGPPEVPGGGLEKTGTEEGVPGGGGKVLGHIVDGCSTGCRGVQASLPRNPDSGEPHQDGAAPPLEAWYFAHTVLIAVSLIFLSLSL